MSPLSEREMEKIDDVIGPIVTEIMALLPKIEDSLPCVSGDMFKRSPVRSLKSALKHIRAAEEALKGIE